MTRVSATTFTVVGDFRGVPVYIGLPYPSVFEWITLYPRSGQNDAPYANGRMNLRYLKVHYEDTTGFTVHVEADGRAPKAYACVPAEPDGIFSVPILARNTQVRIRLSAAPGASVNLSGYEWEGVYHARTRAFRG